VKKEDLRVGMVIGNGVRKNRQITGIGKDFYLFIFHLDEGDKMEKMCLMTELGEWEPVKEKKKITLYRYTWNSKTYEDKHTQQTGWIGFSWEEFFNGAPNAICLKTETKEVEIDD